jgi:hypothetical protein
VALILSISFRDSHLPLPSVNVKEKEKSSLLLLSLQGHEGMVEMKEVKRLIGKVEDPLDLISNLISNERKRRSNLQKD